LYGLATDARLRLTNEEFAKLRETVHMVPAMVTTLALALALALGNEAARIFDIVAGNGVRHLTSVPGFHNEFKRMTWREKWRL
jgi:hypothetical protein